MSLLRAEDYLYDHPKYVPNIYWSELIKTIDQFDQLLEIEKKQISAFLKEQITKKTDMIKKFSQFKDSLKFLGQSIKKQIIFIDKQRFDLFFKGYAKQTREIIKFIIENPKNLANYLLQYKNTKKYNISDFGQNIPVLFYPFYIPLSSKKKSNCLKFMQQIISIWPYSIEFARPKYHSLLDDVIYGFLKIPPIACYVQKISTKFLKEISNCRMQIFAFDEDAIKNQIQIKKHAAVSYNHPQKKSIVSMFKNIFKKGKDDTNIPQTIVIDQGMTSMSDEKSQSEYSNVHDIMKKRQTSFIQLVKNTVENILNQQLPYILKKILQFFNKKIQKQLMKANRPARVELKHYCYFLMTNFICAQLHNKFTMAHEQSGMSNADLQNISQIIRIISSIFQGQDPDLKRYKNVNHTLHQYKDQVVQFYQNILADDKEEIPHEDMREVLIQYFQNNILLSFNDVKIIFDIYQQLKPKKINSKQGDSTQSTQSEDSYMQFLSNPQIVSLFEPNKKVKFQGSLYQAQNLIFMQDWSSKNSKQIVEYFIGNQSPLEYLPMLKDVFFFSSNLVVQQALQVTQDLKLIRKIPLKDVKQYLIKTANKFRHLNIKDFQSVQNGFKDSLKNCLRKSLSRKQYLLYYKSQFVYKLQQQDNLINYYINYLRNQEFYQKISESFLSNIRIKSYLNIQNNLLKISTQAKDLRGLGISNLMLVNNQTLSNKSNEDYILRNSFKSFQKVRDLVRCIGKNQITKMAFITGRKVGEFNAMFSQVCHIVLSYVAEFVNKKKILQNLTKEKLQSLIIKKIQNMLYSRHCTNDKILEDDKKLVKMSHLIDKTKFFKHQIADLGIQTQFLQDQGQQKLKIMIQEPNITLKMQHLQELFKVIFTIVGFTMAKGKISSDIITPIMQFIILDCPDIGHFKCLYAMECLNYNKAPETQFLITSYRSAIMYIKQNMAFDFPKQGCDLQINNHYLTKSM